MKKQILVDTDVIVDFLRGYAKAVSYVENHSDEIVLFPIIPLFQHSAKASLRAQLGRSP